MDFSNQTENDYNRLVQIDWILPVTFIAMFVIIGWWIVAALTYYGVKTGIWSRMNLESVDSGKIYTSVILSGFFCNLFNIISLVHINVGFDLSSNLLCNIMNDVAICLYAMVLLSALMFMWLRQRALYTNKLLNAHYNKFMKAFSLATVLIIWLSAVSTVVLIVLPMDSVSTFQGCFYDVDNFHKYKFIYLAIAGLAFGRLSLLILLAYALRKLNFVTKSQPSFTKTTDKMVSKKRLSFYTISNSSTLSVSRLSQVNLKFSHSSVMVHLIIKKTLVFSCLSLFADAAVFVINFFVIYDNQHNRIAVLTTNISALLNLFLVLFSFVRWKKIITFSR